MLEKGKLSGMRRTIIIFFGIIAILSIIRIATGASDLTSVGTAQAALLLSVPIVLAALGGLFAERAGVVNIGLEGMMIMGAWAGGFMGSKHGPWVGLLAAIFFGAVGALVHAIATITFGVDHVVSGVAINIIAAGLVRYISTILAQGGSWPGPSQSPDVEPIGQNGLPILSGGKYFGCRDCRNGGAGKVGAIIDEQGAVVGVRPGPRYEQLRVRAGDQSADLGAIVHDDCRGGVARRRELERAVADHRPAGVGVGVGEDERAGAVLGEAVGARDYGLDGDGAIRLHDVDHRKSRGGYPERQNDARRILEDKIVRVRGVVIPDIAEGKVAGSIDGAGVAVDEGVGEVGRVVGAAGGRAAVPVGEPAIDGLAIRLGPPADPKVAGGTGRTGRQEQQGGHQPRDGPSRFGPGLHCSPRGVAAAFARYQSSTFRGWVGVRVVHVCGPIDGWVWVVPYFCS